MPFVKEGIFSIFSTISFLPKSSIEIPGMSLKKVFKDVLPKITKEDLEFKNEPLKCFKRKHKNWERNIKKINNEIRDTYKKIENELEIIPVETVEEVAKIALMD